MPKKKRGRGRDRFAEDDEVDTDLENEKLMAEAETAALENPYFSYDRCPRYVRLHKSAGDRESVRIKAKVDEASGGEKLSRAAWRKLASEEIERWETERKQHEENPESLWYMTATANEVRALPREEAKRDGYVHALLIINDKQTLTVGQSLPLKGETTAHHTVFMSEYEESRFASMVNPEEGPGHEGEDGVIAVRTVNDVCAIIVYELAKVVLKRLTACALLDRTLVGHLSLHAEASSKLDEMRRALIQLERHTHAYKLSLDVLKERIACIVKNALEAQRSGALTMAEYIRSSALDETSPGAEASDAASEGEDYCEKTTDEEVSGASTVPVLTEEERDKGAEIINGVKIQPNVGKDLLNALTKSIGPHNIDVERILSGNNQPARNEDAVPQRQRPALDAGATTDPSLLDPVPELETAARDPSLLDPVPELETAARDPSKSHDSTVLVERSEGSTALVNTTPHKARGQALEARAQSEPALADPVPELEEVQPVQEPEATADEWDQQVEMELQAWFREKEGPKASRTKTTTMPQRVTTSMIEETPEATEKRLHLEEYFINNIGMDPAVAKERALTMSLGRRGVTMKVDEGRDYWYKERE